MPIYEYVCVTCGEEFEEIQKFSDPPISGHSCSPKSKVKRKPSLTAFQLKGGGWYKEGYSAAGKDNGNDKANGNGKSATPEDGKNDTDKSKKSADSSTSEKSPSKPPSSKGDGKPASPSN